MKKRIVSIALATVLLLAPAFLSGCQKKCPKPADNIPGTSTFREDCPVEDAAASGKSRVLDFYYVYDNTDDFKEQIQAFQSKNPGLIIKTKKFVSLQEYENEVVNEIAEGGGPDVFMIHNSWITRHQKKLLPMPADLPVPMSAEQFRQTFFQAAADDLLIDNKIYGMPLSIDNLAVYYNAAIFKDLLATTDKPADVWEGIKDQVFQLTKRNNSPERFALSGIAMGRSDNIASAVDTLYALLIQFGAKIYDDKEERALFATPEGTTSAVVSKPGVEALSLFTSFGLPSYKNYSWNDTITGFAPADKEVGPFVRGKVAMILGYPYLYGVLTQGIQNLQKTGEQHIDLKDIGIAPFPQLVTGDETTRRDALASYFPLVVARTTDMPKEAWSFIEYLTSAEALQTYHKKTNRPTSRKDMVADQQTEPLFGVFAYQAPFAKSFRIYDDAAFRQVFAHAIDQVIRNVLTPQEAMQEAQDAITCVVRKSKGLAPADTDCGL